MAISGVNPKCYILALFVRDDGERFLLGDDPFEFKDNQLHFQQNTMANDVVEVQGNDGYLLAGQVRRPGTQMFDGYVCNGTNSKEEVEVKRRAFLQFFRRSHFYKVIYVFPNGTAIQRKQGFLVDDPTVQELYQQYPEYHVALNFEDVNYYTYEEDEQGHEIYAKEAIVALARGGATGGLIWDSYGVVWEDPWSLPLSISGVQFQILNNAGARAPIDNAELYGDTYQQTYSGKNLIDPTNLSFVYSNSPTQIGLSSISNGIRMVNNGGTSQDRFAVFRSVDLTPYIGKVVRMKATFGASGGIRLYRIASDGSNRSQMAFATVSDTEISFTVPSDLGVSPYLGYVLDVTVGGGTTVDFTNLIMTIDESLEPFEPYTGGIPAPNPDYPQDIQVVTGEQTVTVNGKNLADFTTISFGNTNYGTGTRDGQKYTVTSTTSSFGGIFFEQASLKLEPSTTYTFSAKVVSTTTTNGSSVYILNTMNDTGNNIAGNLATEGNITSATFTTPSTIPNSARIALYIRQQNASTVFTDLQIEKSSSVTAYQPYQSQSYTIDLGSTELCKLGDYQDYIYKSGDDWYVHKAIGKAIFDGSETWSTSTSEPGRWNITGTGSAAGSSTTNYILSDKYIARYAIQNGSIFLSNNAGRISIVDTTHASLSDWKTWLGTNNVTAYFRLATATNTKITDATLVGQLDVLGAMKLFIGENNVLVSTPTPNLPATLAFDYYTKFAAIGAEWEEGGTKGATIVNVDAIDNTYPVWGLTGPATNPTLSVLTTNTALTYNGTITASQKLVIDMFNKTATLNGTSVIGNISGDFVYMAPGTNRLAYTAGNTDAPDSTIYWQEVVG